MLVDDHPLYRAGVRRALELSGISVVAEAADEAEARARAAGTLPEVCLVDLRLGTSDGALLIEALRAAHPALRLIALTAFDDPVTAARAERAGADGFLSKEINAAGLVAEVRAAAAQAPSPPLPVHTRGAITAHRPLSARQQAVLDGLAAGKTVREISEQLGITARTVETYRAVLKRKLGVHSAAALRELVEEKGRSAP